MLASVIAAIFAVMLAALAAAVPAPAHYLALGDSLAVGVGATHGEDAGYVRRFFNSYARKDPLARSSLTNLAISGETSGTYLANGQHHRALEAINADHDIAVITLGIGANDFLDLLRPGRPCAMDPASPLCQGAVAIAIQQLAANVSVIIPDIAAALDADPGEERFVVLTYYNVFGGTGFPIEAIADQVLLGADLTVDCDAEPSTWGVNDILACTALASGVEIVDLYAPFADDSPSLTHIRVGDVHPNDQGHALIAGVLGAGQ